MCNVDFFSSFWLISTAQKCNKGGHNLMGKVHYLLGDVEKDLYSHLCVPYCSHV